MAEEVKKGGITSRTGVWDTSILPCGVSCILKAHRLESSSCVNSTGVETGGKSVLVYLVWTSI